MEKIALVRNAKGRNPSGYTLAYHEEEGTYLVHQEVDSVEAALAILESRSSIQGLFVAKISPFEKVDIYRYRIKELILPS